MEDTFSDVPTGMLALLLDGVLPDQAVFVRKMWSEHWVFGLAALAFILIASLTIMNLLVGVLVEVVNVVSFAEKEHLQAEFVKASLLSCITGGCINENGDYLISKAEFENILRSEEAVTVLDDVDV